MAGITKKQKNAKTSLLMSDTYYDTKKLSIATTKANKICKYEELSGKTVGVKNGTLPLNVSSVSKINTVSLLKPLIQVI